MIIKADFIIIGAGVLGLAMAREILKRHPDSKIAVLEKENQIGLHASGRNSGVLHSGIYYLENSLKARVCGNGAKMMAAYCDENNLSINRLGKIIVPVKESQAPQLDTLVSRAKANQVRVEILDSLTLKEIEPELKSACGKALHCPDTAVIDSKEILQHLEHELKSKNVNFYFNSKITEISMKKRVLKTQNQIFNFSYLINTAGLFADRVAAQCGLKDKYTMLPFKGMYFKLDPKSKICINKLIYPVPDLNMPFLGVHFTKTIGNDVLIGPNAIPALGRENYVGMQGIEWKEMPRILFNSALLFLRNKQGFRNYALEEIYRISHKNFVKAASTMIPTVKKEHIVKASKVGIRAQLFDRDKQELVMDFLYEQYENSVHILNAVSPAFTSSFSFSELVADIILK